MEFLVGFVVAYACFLTAYLFIVRPKDRALERALYSKEKTTRAMVDAFKPPVFVATNDTTTPELDPDFVAAWAGVNPAEEEDSVDE